MLSLTLWNAFLNTPNPNSNPIRITTAIKQMHNMHVFVPKHILISFSPFIYLIFFFFWDDNRGLLFSDGSWNLWTGFRLNFIGSSRILKPKTKRVLKRGECLNAMGIVGLKGKQFFQFLFLSFWLVPFSFLIVCLLWVAVDKVVLLFAGLDCWFGSFLFVVFGKWDGTWDMGGFSSRLLKFISFLFWKCEIYNNKLFNILKYNKIPDQRYNWITSCHLQELIKDQTVGFDEIFSLATRQTPIGKLHFLSS